MNFYFKLIGWFLLLGINVSALGLETPKAIYPIRSSQVFSGEKIVYQWVDQSDAKRYQFLVYDRVSDSVLYRSWHDRSEICQREICSLAPDVSVKVGENHKWRVMADNSSQRSDFSQTFFNVIEAPKPEPKITGIQLIDADSNKVIQNLSISSSPQEINLAKVGKSLNLNVLIEDGASVEFVSSFHSQKESVAPYAFYGDSSGNYNSWTPNLGESRVEITPYEQASLKGEAGESVTLSLNFIESLPPQIPVSLSPINHEEIENDIKIEYKWRDQEFAESYDFLIYDRTIDSVILRSKLLKADVCKNGSCSFSPDLSVSVGENHKWRVGAINMLGASELNQNFFGVVEKALPVPRISSLELINASNESVLKTFPGSGGPFTIDLAQTGKALNFNAVAVNSNSVRFESNQGSRSESAAPFAFKGDISGNYSSWTPKLGELTIEVFPYAETSLKGEMGTSVVYNFKVIDSSIVEETAPAPIPAPETSQEFSLSKLEQLSDARNAGRTALVKSNINLGGKTIAIADGLTLKAAGGSLSNGILSGSFKIDTSIRTKIFEKDIKFSSVYKSTLYPEHFGAAGNGSRNDSAEIKLAMELSEKVELKENASYLISSPIHINRSGSVNLDGKKARLLNNGVGTQYMIELQEKLSSGSIKNLEIDGRDKSPYGLRTYVSGKLDGLFLHDFHNANGNAFGLRFDIRKEVQMSLVNSKIEMIVSENNGKIGDSIGASRAIGVYWYDNSGESSVLIENNDLLKAYGEDGDILQISELSGKYYHKSRTIINNNRISEGPRRLLKGTASNIIVTNNIFKSMDPSSSRANNQKNRTASVSFGFYNGNTRVAGTFVQGIVFKGNVLDNSFGYDGRLNFNNVEGQIVEENTFINSIIAFGQENRSFTIRNNSLENTNIRHFFGTTIDGDNKVVGNKMFFGGNSSIRGFVTQEFGGHFKNLTIENNEITTLEESGDTFYGIFYSLYNKNFSSQSTQNLKILNNKLIRRAAAGRSSPMQELMRFGLALDRSSAIIGNRLESPLNSPKRGIMFHGGNGPAIALPQAAEVRDNFNSFGVELLPQNY